MSRLWALLTGRRAQQSDMLSAVSAPLVVRDEYIIDPYVVTNHTISPDTVRALDGAKPEFDDLLRSLAKGNSYFRGLG
jgi:hypothetical protein